MSKRIVFFGGVGSPKQYGGELSKNKEIIRRLEQIGYKLIVLDSFGSRKRKAKLMVQLLRLFCNVAFHPRSAFLFSTSLGNIYPIIKMLRYYPVKLNLIYWGIGGFFADRIKSGHFNAKYLTRITTIIVEGEKMKQTLIQCGFTNVFVKPNFKRIGQLPAIQKCSNGKKCFYFLSRIIPQKGVGYILNCAQRLNKNGYADKYVIHFYGNIAPEYQVEFNGLVGQLPNVEYRGTIQLLDWSNYRQLAGYHFMLFPTYWIGEGFPGVIIDAFIAGTPIIASDWSLNTEYVKEGETGLIVHTHDEEGLYQRMLDVINDKYDCLLMSEKCQRAVHQFDTENVIASDFIEQIVY